MISDIIESGGEVVLHPIVYTGQAITKEEWVKHGEQIYGRAKAVTWQLADWAAYGDKEWGALKEFCDLHDYNYDSLRVYASTANRVKLLNRLNTLSFAHHSEVASLPEREQRKWLKIANDEKLPVSKLRERIRTAKGEHNAKDSDGPIVRMIGAKCDDLKSFLIARPPEFWHEQNKAIWRDRLKPLVEFYQTL